MDDEAMNPTPAPRRRGFRGQFSLREMLLATTAVCGLVAAFYNHRPFAPTAFLNTFRPQQVAEPLVKAANPTNLSYGSSGGGGTSYNGRSATQQFALTFHATKPTAGELLAALRTSIEGELAKHGCKIFGRSVTGDSAFGFEYEAGNVAGVIWVIGYQFDDRVEIQYYAHEHR